MTKLWMYHSDHNPRVFQTKDQEMLESQGWRDNPMKCAGFTTKLKPAIDDAASCHMNILRTDTDKARALAINEVSKKTQIGTDSLNVLANDKKAIKAAKKELEAAIKADHGVDVDLRKHKGYQGLNSLLDLKEKMDAEAKK